MDDIFCVRVEVNLCSLPSSSDCQKTLSVGTAIEKIMPFCLARYAVPGWAFVRACSPVNISGWVESDLLVACKETCVDVDGYLGYPNDHRAKSDFLDSFCAENRGPPVVFGAAKDFFVEPEAIPTTKNSTFLLTSLVVAVVFLLLFVLWRSMPVKEDTDRLTRRELLDLCAKRGLAPTKRLNVTVLRKILFETTNILLESLPAHITISKLRTRFSSFGRVIYVRRAQIDDKVPDVGFVAFAEQVVAMKAFSALTESNEWVSSVSGGGHCGTNL